MEEREPMQSPDVGKLAEALAKAQSEMEGATKDAKNPFFNSDYSTLFSVWQACREPLTKNGLSVIQTTGGNGTGIITVYTILAHSSGQWIKGALSITPAKTDPQTLGSCLTYLRRYALAAMVGLSPLDDDGEAATKEARKAPKQPTKTPEKVDKAPTPIQVMIGKFATAKAVLNKKTGDDKIYYAALETLKVKHANEIKTVPEGNKLLAEFRTFLTPKKEENAATFPPED
jgi:hypothetical protein